MGNKCAECIQNQTTNKHEISTEKEDLIISDDYKRKTTSDEALKYFLSKRLLESHSPRSYTKGSVKISTL